MPLRIRLFQCLKTPIAPPTSVCRTFASSSTCQQSSAPKKRKHLEPWQVAQTKAKKAANLSRRDVLKKERDASIGDPVRGNMTAFVQSFDTAQPPRTLQAASTAERDLDNRLNFFLSKEDLDTGIEHSEYIFTTDAAARPDLDDHSSSDTPKEAEAKQQVEHANATEALRRISSLSLASSADLHRINTQRIINIFGRHNTDQVLESRPTAPLPEGAAAPLAKIPRVGVDTGSSEVQIAILTAKIKTLADFQETRGRHDKHNKRNLRLLVHRRQRLLRYLERKERGGPRFQNIVKALGLTKGAWVGEISLP